MKQKTQSEVTVNESRHTPGEWKVIDCLKGHLYPFGIYNSSEHTILAYVTSNTKNGSSEANARLIAAAPDMLEALKEIKFKTECGNLTTMAMGTIGDICVKAIAKATNSK